MPSGRPPIHPRTQKSPLGEVLAHRGITPRGLGEAIALREGRPERVGTAMVNRWIWGRHEPSPWRQQIIAELLALPREELFPPRPRPRKPQPKPSGAADLRLIETAERLRPDPEAADALIARARAQESLDSDSPEAVQSIDYRASSGRRASAQARAQDIDYRALNAHAPALRKAA